MNPEELNEQTSEQELSEAVEQSIEAMGPEVSEIQKQLIENSKQLTELFKEYYENLIEYRKEVAEGASWAHVWNDKAETLRPKIDQLVEENKQLEKELIEKISQKI